MSVYELNVRALKSNHMDIWQALQNSTMDDSIVVGDAMDGSAFLAVVKEDQLVPMSSIYSPRHEAVRFMQQFVRHMNPMHIVIFGLGNGEVIRFILQNNDLFEECIVCEPSLGLLNKAMEVYELHDILSNPRLRILVSGVNEDQLYRILNNELDYANYEEYHYVCLPKYRELFETEELLIDTVFTRAQEQGRVDRNTLFYFAKQGSDNEILSLQWLIQGKSIYGLKPYITQEDTCIVVAAGPSLNKNINDLHAAVGKAFIFCVDSALNYLLSHDIIPDMICTLDPDKGINIRHDERLADVPIACSPESDHKIIEMFEQPEVMCFSAGNSYFQELFRETGCEMPYFYGGGSVATSCFKLAAELGFHKIILIGQDLALEGGRIHADGEVGEESMWKQLEVPGYYGEPVTTLTDYKMYLDWYEDELQRMPDVMVIDATEGGARIEGTVIMPLSEAIHQCCRTEFCFRDIYDQIPYIWNTSDKRRSLINRISSYRTYLAGLKKQVESACHSYHDVMMKYQKKQLTVAEANQINQVVDRVIHEIMEGEGSILLYKRMIQTELTFRKQLFEVQQQEVKDEEKIQELTNQYLNEAHQCITEMLVCWDEVLTHIGEAAD